MFTLHKYIQRKEERNRTSRVREIKEAYQLTPNYAHYLAPDSNKPIIKNVRDKHGNLDTEQIFDDIEEQLSLGVIISVDTAREQVSLDVVLRLCLKTSPYHLDMHTEIFLDEMIHLGLVSKWMAMGVWHRLNNWLRTQALAGAIGCMVSPSLSRELRERNRF